MSKLALKDRAQDRIGSVLAKAATSLVLADVTEFGSTKLTPPFLVMVDSGMAGEEIMLVTAVTELTKTLTVQRGMLGTTDVAHSVDALVIHTGTPVVLTARVADISTAETLYLMLPKCVIVEVSTVLTATIATANSILTLSKNAQAITGGVITIAYDGSVAGDIDIIHPTVYTDFNGSSDYLKIVGGGQSTNAAPVLITILAMMG